MEKRVLAKKHTIAAFTLIELLIAITIVSILAAVAVPVYFNHTRKAYYSEIVSATAAYKLGVVECMHTTGELMACDAGMHGIPRPIMEDTGAIATLTVKSGVITVTPVAKHGITSVDTYVLEPIEKNGLVLWESSGGGVEAGYAK